MKETFIVRTEWYAAISKLSENEQAALFKDLFEYHLGNLNNLSVNLNNPSLNLVLVWNLIEPNLQRNINSYDKRKETSKLNGSLGGRPPKEPNPKPNKPKKPNETLSDSVSDIKKKLIKKKISFEDCDIYDKQEFAKQFSSWSKDKLRYYYDTVLTWSNEGNKKIDWIATVRNWAARDEKKGDLKFTPDKANNEKPSISAAEFYGYGK